MLIGNFRAFSPLLYIVLFFPLLLLHFSLCPKNFTTAIEQLVSLGVLLYTYTNIQGKALSYFIFFLKKERTRAHRGGCSVASPFFGNRKK